MAGELEFSALHSDDRLLDALAARCGVDTDDTVANLLAALAAEVDARPVPLGEALAGGLLSRPLVSARTETAAVSAGAASATLAGQGDVLTREPELDAAAPGAAPPVAAPLASRRRLRMMLPRAAATAGVAAVVLGAGGVAAAVGGGGSAFDGFRQVVGNVIRPVAPDHSREDRVSRLLEQASVALRTNDTHKAQELLVRAKSQLAGLHSSLAKTLQEKLTVLQTKLQNVQATLASTVPLTGAGTAPRSAGQHDAKNPAASPATTSPTSPAPITGGVPAVKVPLGSSPEDAAESPADARSDGIMHDLPGPDLGNPADTLPGSQKLPAESKITETEREVQEKAGTVPVPAPDEVDTPVGPVHPLRAPSSADVADDPSVNQVVLEVAPKAGAAADGVAGGNP